MDRLYKLFPFSHTNQKLHFLQCNLVTLIQSPSFIFALPEISDQLWTVLKDNVQERERLEFLGDALIGSAISEELFRCRPDEGPNFYTNCRSVLAANSTFAHLMWKVGFFRPGEPVKKAGDAFEAVLAAFHGEVGLETFQIYVRKYFLPLIECVAFAYDQHRLETSAPEYLSQKPRLLGRNRAVKKHRKKISKSRKPSHHPEPSLPATSRITRSLSNNLDQRKPSRICSTVIDLTSDNDPEEAIWQPPSAPQASSSNFRRTQATRFRADTMLPPIPQSANSFIPNTRLITSPPTPVITMIPTQPGIQLVDNLVIPGTMDNPILID